MTHRPARLRARAQHDLARASFERVAACTMSHQLSAAAGRSVSGEAALAGTAAHSVLEWCLRYGRSPDQIEAVFVEGQRFGVDARMRAAVQFALDWVGRTSPGGS